MSSCPEQVGLANKRWGRPNTRWKSVLSGTPDGERARLTALMEFAMLDAVARQHHHDPNVAFQDIGGDD
jgi:hypothetical protein